MMHKMCRVRISAAVGAISLLLLVTACGTTTSAAKSGPSFKNPVFNQDFPDPFVLQAGKTYYAYATAQVGGGAFVPELRSTDLIHWKQTGDAMPIPGRWADKFWAPTVVRLNNGQYGLYYTGEYPKIVKECIGFATSSAPAGPFKETRTKPFLCQASLGGTIDAHAFRDGKTVYLYYKNDGNCCGIPTHIWVQKLSNDGSKLLGKPVSLTYNNQPWEDTVVEAPFVLKHGKSYILFFSGNHWDGASYAVGYATCKGPMGPCAQAKDNPILAYKFHGCKAEGPGGETIVTDKSGTTWIIYAAWVGDATAYGSVGGKRALWMDKIIWKGNTPSISGPTCKAQPGPLT